jgi:uncharacterized membrane protein YdjX (TVP38/TMEM64 family)
MFALSMSDLPSDAEQAEQAGAAASAWARAGVLLLITVGLAFFATADVLHQFVVRLVETAETAITAYPAWGITLFVVLSAVSAMLTFFSTAVVTPVAVETWGEPASIALLWGGWLLGGGCAYVIGRTLGRPVTRFLISPRALARFERRISNRAPFGVVLLFQFALPSEVPGYVLGLARYPFSKYALALAIAELPFAIGTVYLGASVLERRTILLFPIAGAGALASILAFYLLQRRLAR